MHDRGKVDDARSGKAAAGRRGRRCGGLGLVVLGGGAQRGEEELRQQEVPDKVDA